MEFGSGGEIQKGNQGMTQLSLFFLSCGLMLCAFILLRIIKSQAAMWRQHEADMQMLRHWIDEHLAAHIAHGANDLILLRLLQELKQPATDE